MMRLGLALLLLLVGADLQDANRPELRYFRYERPVLKTTSADTGQICAVLPPEVFAHAAPQLADLRLYRETTEVPYVLRTAEPVGAKPASLQPLNLGVQGGSTVFDVAMPVGKYSDVDLSLSAENFTAKVTVSGSQQAASPDRTTLGTFTIFDLSKEKLGRSTVLHLPASDFRWLHFAIASPIRPEQVNAVTVRAQSETETHDTTVAESSQVTTRGRQSVVVFIVPARVPVDHVVFEAGDSPASFSRAVSITVKQRGARGATVDIGEAPPQPVTLTGSVLRVHREENGEQIDEERLRVGTGDQVYDSPTEWTVAVENGDDPPLTLRSVWLVMDERDLCFQAEANAGYALFYGDNALPAPQYDYSTLFVPEDNPTRVALGSEFANPVYQPRPDQRPFTEKHPLLLWLALLGAICVLGAVALRSGLRGREAS